MDQKKIIQQERLFYIEFLALFIGRVSRKDIIKRFGISEAAATKDLSLYTDQSPEVLQYDIREKTYVLSEVKPFFEHDIDQSLFALAGERAIALHSNHAKRLINSVSINIKRTPSLKVVTAITRSMYQNTLLEADYSSLSSGHKSRLLSPLVLIHDGLRWHIRCFNHDKNIYADFNLSRFSKAVMGKYSNANLTDDSEWNNEVILKLIPHPRAEHPETIKMDYEITENNFKEVKLKSCLVGYFIRHWNVDYSLDSSGNPKAQQLFLDNREELVQEGVTEWAFKD